MLEVQGGGVVKLHVNTPDLRKALSAVIPHAGQPGPEQVRVTATPENVFVQATNGVTAGLSLVSVWEHEGLSGDPAEDSLFLSTSMAKELLQVFKPISKPESELDDQLSVELDDAGQITVTDVSGLFPGKSWSMPHTEKRDLFPNLPALFARALEPAVVSPERIFAQGRMIRLFTSAAAAYGEPLVLEPTPSAKQLLISCGESFLGALAQARLEEGSEKLQEFQEHRAAWPSRLDQVAFALSQVDEEAA